MRDWTPELAGRDKPHYLAIADAIAEDIRNGRLSPSDRLPPQRKLARRLQLDFTTVARGYVEAKKRGLVDSRIGRGTFVRASARPEGPGTRLKGRRCPYVVLGSGQKGGSRNRTKIRRAPPRWRAEALLFCGAGDIRASRPTEQPRV